METVRYRDMSTRYADRFWVKVAKSEGCWLWQGSKNAKGYGKLYVNGAMRYAHRLSWELANGPIPGGLFVCHHCDTPGCVNPTHLFVGTAGDNIRDAVRKGRFVSPGALKTHCKRGHLLAGNNLALQRRADYVVRVCRECTRSRQREFARRKRAAQKVTA